jgi:uncharacterized sporulation protein YeaH/YhbH (DUF444 family)
MKSRINKLYQKLKKNGLSAQQEEIILSELNGIIDHPVFGKEITLHAPAVNPKELYDFHDLMILQQYPKLQANASILIRSMDDLLERDKQRERDGFPRKIRVGRLIKPGKSGKDKIVVVPTTVEEKFIHDNSPQNPEEQSPSGGTGEGEEGEVIGEQPVHSTEGAGAGQAGQGENGPHEMESSAYDLGRILTEKFQLPNLKDKGKKRSLTRYTYDLTDKNRGFGQVLDKKATLKKVVETNIHLGNIPDFSHINPEDFIISPKDKVYRVLSKEKDYESQAMVFFLRDYSGSMSGKPTELVVGQHILIYSWLLYQYAKQVESRFVLHDTEAKEVPDFFTYYNSQVAGGTKIASAFQLVNELVAKNNLAKDYNIYVFYGTDGDDWDTGGKETLDEMKKMMKYANRIGITVARQGYGSTATSELERYMKSSNLLLDHPALIRMDIIDKDAEESRLIEGIKKLISE